MPAGGPLASYTIRARFLGALAAVALTVGLGACGARTGDHTFAPMPETCDELTQEIDDGTLPDGRVSDPDATLATSGETRILTCTISGGHAELPTDIRSLVITVTQAAQDAEAVRGMPVAQWLEQEVIGRFEDDDTGSIECVPDPVHISGTSVAGSCAYVEHDIYVSARVVAAAPDARIFLSAHVTLADAAQPELTLADLEAAAEAYVQSLAAELAQQLR